MTAGKTYLRGNLYLIPYQDNSIRQRGGHARMACLLGLDDRRYRISKMQLASDSGLRGPCKEQDLLGLHVLRCNYGI